MKKFVCLVAIVVALSGCTDAGMAKLASYGNNSLVQCYSGERLIFEGTSTGKVSNEANSDGYFFEDSATGLLMQVSGNCVITTKK